MRKQVVRAVRIDAPTVAHEKASAEALSPTSQGGALQKSQTPRAAGPAKKLTLNTCVRTRRGYGERATAYSRRAEVFSGAPAQKPGYPLCEKWCYVRRVFLVRLSQEGGEKRERKRERQTEKQRERQGKRKRNRRSKRKRKKGKKRTREKERK